MRPQNSAFAGGHMPRFMGIVATVSASLLLAACASSGGSSGGGGLSGLFGGSNPNAGTTTVQSTTLDPNYFLKTGYCPPVQVLPGTEAMIVYERGHDGDAAAIQAQGSITKTARECHMLDASTMPIKVGVAGRVLAGPKGGSGTVTLPLRIAVTRQHDNSVLFSKAYPLKAVLTAPEFSNDYSDVYDQVVFKVGPEDRDLIVYVGFDEGKPKDTGRIPG